jgi:regulator of replication initiation timing
MATANSTQFVSEVIKNPDYKNFIKSLLEETVKEQLKTFAVEVSNLKEQVSKLKDEIDELKGEHHELACKNEKLASATSNNERITQQLAHTLTARSLAIEDLQQYTRRNCILVTGVPEVQGDENTDEIIMELANEKMNIPLKEDDLDRSHRIGRPTIGKPRAIVVKFARYNMRQKFMTNREQKVHD